jgi:hypothetical protein
MRGIKLDTAGLRAMVRFSVCYAWYNIGLDIGLVWFCWIKGSTTPRAPFG